MVMIISEQEKNRIRGLHVVKEQWQKIDINEEPEKDTYWMITKANKNNLISMGGTAEEIGRSATNNFQKYCK